MSEAPIRTYRRLTTATVAASCSNDPDASTTTMPANCPELDRFVALTAAAAQTGTPPRAAYRPNASETAK